MQFGDIFERSSVDDEVAGLFETTYTNLDGQGSIPAGYRYLVLSDLGTYPNS
jgi:hypothetical protein